MPGYKLEKGELAPLAKNEESYVMRIILTILVCNILFISPTQLLSGSNCVIKEKENVFQSVIRLAPTLMIIILE